MAEGAATWVLRAARLRKLFGAPRTGAWHTGGCEAKCGRGLAGSKAAWLTDGRQGAGWRVCLQAAMRSSSSEACSIRCSMSGLRRCRDATGGGGCDGSTAAQGDSEVQGSPHRPAPHIHTHRACAPEVADEALNGPGGGVSQGADGVALNLLGHLPQHVNLLQPGNRAIGRKAGEGRQGGKQGRYASRQAVRCSMGSGSSHCKRVRRAAAPTWRRPSSCES